jgi:multiple sugar transport system substrate-binding protein
VWLSLTVFVNKFVKIGLQICAVFVLLGALGCTIRPQSEEGAVKLKFMMWGLPDELATVKEYIRKFNQKHPEIRVEIIHKPQGYDTSLDTMLAGGAPPDVFYVSAERLPLYASRNQLVDLGPCVEYSRDFSLDDFYPQTVEPFRWQGKLYGIPKDFTTLVMYYNKTHFDKMGMAYPNANWTWDDFLDAAIRLTEQGPGGRTKVYGFILETWLGEWLPWVMQNGGALMNESRTRWLLGDPAYIDANEEAIQFLVDLVVKHKVAPSAEVTSDLGTFDLFQRGSAAMCTYGRWKCMDFKHIKDFEWDVAPIPHRKKRVSMLFTVSYAIAQGSQHKQEAWELIKFLTGPEGQLATAESGHAIPSMRSVAMSDNFLKAPVIPRPINAMVFLDAIPHSQVPPTRPDWQEISDVMGREMDMMWRGQRPVRETLLKIQPQVEKILAASAALAAQAMR